MEPWRKTAKEEDLWEGDRRLIQLPGIEGLVEATYSQTESWVQEMDEIRKGEYVWRDEG